MRKKSRDAEGILREEEKGKKEEGQRPGADDIFVTWMPPEPDDPARVPQGQRKEQVCIGRGLEKGVVETGEESHVEA